MIHMLPRCRARRCAGIAHLGCVLVLTWAASASAFDYAGVGPGTDIASLRETFPESRHEFWERGTASIFTPDDGEGLFADLLRTGQGRYVVRLSRDETRAQLTEIAVTLDQGVARRWTLGFERDGDGLRPEQVERRHPGCRGVLDALVARFGQPQSFTSRMDEGLELRRRTWNAADGSMTLECGRFDRRTAIFARDLEIAPKP